jgi:hypothetical protein
MGEWNDGTLEYWNNGILGLKAAKVVLPVIPLFHHSIIPIF